MQPYACTILLCGLSDSGSRNGVFIDGKRVVRPMELRVGKTMIIEDYEFN